ncbi:MAG: MaoC/PaaZ C-terminal domain-containing protein [Steroidobacteraceae bacterium]
MTRPIEFSLRRLPSGLVNYPAVLLRRRPAVTVVVDPPEIRCRVARVVIDAADVARYSSVCGFGPGVPVTYPHVLAMPLHLAIFAQERFPLRPMGLIHLSNVIENLGELHPGQQFAIEVAARNYQRIDAGLAFDMTTEITSGGGPAWRETCVFMSRWPESAERAGARPPRPPRAPKDSAVLAETDVTPGTAWAYARVSGDYNPIHLNDRAARFFGLRGAIGHGMWSLARSLAQAPGPAIARGARIEARYLTPVQLPGRVAIKEWAEDGQVKRALCDVRTGRVHMVAGWQSPEGITPA